MGFNKTLQKRKIIQAFLKKQEKSQISNLTYHIKEFDKEEHIKPKNSRREEI